MDSWIASTGGYSRDDPSTYCNLRSAYTESILKAEAIAGEEDSRRLRLKIVLLEEENDELHEQLGAADDQINTLEQECTDWREQVDSFEAKSRCQETQLRVKVRELHSIKAELSSMSGLSVDSMNLLTEKLSLARELATLKPELEHLRSQVTFQQTILAEKLALQRQINILEIKLQTESRHTTCAISKDKTHQDVESLERQVHELQTELSKERREKEKVQRIAENETREWESRVLVLESKVEQLRVKVRDGKTQMKLLQNDLFQGQAVRRKHSEPSPGKTQPTLNSRKRSAVEMTTDKAVGTPDGFSIRGRRQTERRGKRDQTLLGEKSMFSITPYLNRTICIGPDSTLIVPEPKVVGEQRLSAELLTPNKHQPLSIITENITASENEAERFHKQDIFTNSENTNVNTKVTHKKGRAIAILGKVTEDCDENADSTGMIDSMGGAKCSFDILTSIVKDKEPQKKRRKILGTTKTLFDEENGSAKRSSTALLGPAKSIAKSGQNRGKISLGVDTKRNSAVFGAFSPLKREKRGLQASFLA